MSSPLEAVARAHVSARTRGDLARATLRGIGKVAVLVVVLAVAVGLGVRARGGARALARDAIHAATRELGARQAKREVAFVHARLADEAARTKSTMVRLASDMVAFPGARDVAPVVYLHGIHGRPENGCPWMRGAGGWLVCPRADVVEPNGTASWSGAHTASAIVRATEVARRARGPHGPRLTPRAEEEAAPVLVGFSQGAYEVDALLRRGTLRARGLVLLAADVSPDLSALRAAGVRRIALGGGEADPTFPTLRATAARLAKEGAPEGIEVKLLSLGAVGHVYVGEDPEVLRAAIRWAAEG